MFIAGRVVLRKLLGRRLNLSPSDVPIVVDELGKPGLKGNRKLNFSLSHSGDFLAVAIGDTVASVGIDVESFSEDRPFRRLALRFFEREAAENVLSESGAAAVYRFLHFWTAKEAVLKAVGTGLRIPLREVGLRFSPEFNFATGGLRGHKKPEWNIFSWKEPEQWILSLAVSGRGDFNRPELQTLDFSEVFSALPGDDEYRAP